MEALLSGIEPSEADLVQMALDMPLDKKIEKAILFYQTYCDGAYGAFSGGKDSCVIKQLAIDAGVEVDWHYNNVTIDPPELVRFIKKVHPDVKWNNPKKHLITRMIEKCCAPTMFRRWCCAEYKEQGGADSNKIIGVRIAESPRRAKLWQQIVPHRKTGKLILCPIVYWTDRDIWEFIKLRHLPYSEIYDEPFPKGTRIENPSLKYDFDRIGCVGCPLQTPAQQQQDFERWPRFKDMWYRGFVSMWNKYHGTLNAKGKPRGFEKYGSADGWWSWWTIDRKQEEAKERTRGQCMFDEMMGQR